MSAAQGLDAIVVGAGHNGLAATALLYARGLRVLCLLEEQTEQVPSVPGVGLAALVSLLLFAADPPAWRSLGLVR